MFLLLVTLGCGSDRQGQLAAIAEVISAEQVSEAREAVESPYGPLGFREVLCTTELSGPMAVNKDWVFYFGTRPVPGGLIRYPLAGGNEEHVAPWGCVNYDPADKTIPKARANGTHVFWADGGVCRAPVAGGDTEVLLGGNASEVRDIELSGDAIYLSDYGAIRRMRLDGTDNIALTQDVGAGHIALDETHVWFTRIHAPFGIARIPLDGGEVEDVVAPLSLPPLDVTVDDEWILWTEHECPGSVCSIFVASKTEGTPKILTTSSREPLNLLAQDGYLYWIGIGFDESAGPAPMTQVHRTAAVDGVTVTLGYAGNGYGLWASLVGDEVLYLDPDQPGADGAGPLDRHCILAVPRFPEDWQ